MRKSLLMCGILASLLYVGSDIVAAMRWEGYSYANQAVSELRALGSPTRSFLVPILIVYGILECAFGFGTRLSAGQKRSLRITGVLLIALGLLDISGFLFPMHVREELGRGGGSLIDTAHIVATAVTVLLILLVIGFGATADGKWFRIYSYVTILVLIGAGTLTSMDANELAAGLPTPWMGLKERINIYGYMLWMAMLALVLLRAGVPAAEATATRAHDPETSDTDSPSDRLIPV